MSAQIDGASWNADDYVEARRPTATFLQVSGGDRNPWTVSSSVNSPVVGTQTFSAAPGNCTFSNSSGNFTGTAGEITITTLTAQRVAGTFACGQVDRYDDGSGPRTKTITNGTFDVTF